MDNDDRIGLLMGWCLLILCMGVLTCYVAYRLDQVNRRLDNLMDIMASETDAEADQGIQEVPEVIPADAETEEPTIELVGGYSEAPAPDILDDSKICDKIPTSDLKAIYEAPEALVEGAIMSATTEASESAIEEVTEEVNIIQFEPEPERPHLTKQAGVFDGPSGKETYYNLNMSGVVSIMRGMGYTEEEYPYWVRDDGCKMLGDYVMVAASFDIRPRGTILETSLGAAIVCDTGGFAYSNPTQIDIAVNW